ncbi:Uma2 family endonuclease [Nocardia thailandica]
MVGRVLPRPRGCDDDYSRGMSARRIDPASLPEFMTWEELESLPAEIAERIELWAGRVVWVRRGPAEHQTFTALLWGALQRHAGQVSSPPPHPCWRAALETNIFLQPSGKSDFLTPDFLIHRCLPPYSDIRASDVLLVGEVLSPSNSRDIEAKRARYADAGIPWYWEVRLAEKISAIDTVRAYVLQTEIGTLPPGVHPLHRANYVTVDEWTPTDPHGIVTEFPFPITIDWSDLTF